MDATIPDVGASYCGTIKDSLDLAGNGTYLLDEEGNRMMLKPPRDNESLELKREQRMDGKPVFLGTVWPGTKSINLVISDHNDSNGIISPGLTIAIPHEGAVPQLQALRESDQLWH